MLAGTRSTGIGRSSVIAMRRANRTSFTDAPLGYLTAYDVQTHSDSTSRSNCGPDSGTVRSRLPRSRCTRMATGHVTIPIIRNVHKLFDAFHKHGDKPLPRTLARQLLTLHRNETLETWIESLNTKELCHRNWRASSSRTRRRLCPESSRGAKSPASLTYQRTAKRSFEVNYWKTIAALSEGTFLNKNNADCVRDAVTQKTHLPITTASSKISATICSPITRRKIAAAKHERQSAWRAKCRFGGGRISITHWMGGWLKNQEAAAERDIARGHSRPGSRAAPSSCPTTTTPPTWPTSTTKSSGGCGARIAACGADDNHSATAAMMLAAPIFLRDEQTRASSPATSG